MCSIHPISSLIREANQIFLQMGFTFAEGPLLESEWYNFDALNVPKDHPARDMQDTFYLPYEGTLPHIELARKLTIRNPHNPPKVGDRLGPQKEDIVPEAQVLSFGERAGLGLAREFPAGARHYGLILKPMPL